LGENFPKNGKIFAKVFETIKLNKKLMPKIWLKHSIWVSCLKVYLNEHIFRIFRH
jgi:hypothetical protein